MAMRFSRIDDFEIDALLNLFSPLLSHLDESHLQGWTRCLCKDVLRQQLSCCCANRRHISDILTLSVGHKHLRHFGLGSGIDTQRPKLQFVFTWNPCSCCLLERLDDVAIAGVIQVEGTPPGNDMSLSLGGLDEGSSWQIKHLPTLGRTNTHSGRTNAYAR